jgi:hypothetical protein
MRQITRKLAGPAAAMAVLVATAAAPAMAGGGGKPTVEHEVIHQTFFDDYAFGLCGVETETTQTQRTIIKTFPDGSQTVHRIAEWVPDDPSIASERWARTDRIAPDGTLTIVGLAIRVFRHGEGTIIRDAGWVRVLEDGLVVRGPHPFLDTDPADVYC